jgi:hypothetical protein
MWILFTSVSNDIFVVKTTYIKKFVNFGSIILACLSFLRVLCQISCIEKLQECTSRTNEFRVNQSLTLIEAGHKFNCSLCDNLITSLFNEFEFEILLIKKHFEWFIVKTKMGERFQKVVLYVLSWVIGKTLKII